MDKSRRRPTQNYDKPNSVIIDYSKKFESSEVENFLISELQIQPLKSSERDNMLCLSLKKDDCNKVLNFNGHAYKGVTLFISFIDFKTFQQTMSTLISYFIKHTKGKTIDLSNSHDNSFPLNLNYVKHFQFALFTLAVYARDSNFDITKIDLNNNNISSIKPLENANVFLPSLKVISLIGNNLDPNSEAILSKLHSKHIRTIINNQDDDNTEQSGDDDQNENSQYDDEGNGYDEEEMEEEGGYEENSQYDDEDLRKGDDENFKAAPSKSFVALNHAPIYTPKIFDYGPQLLPFIDGFLDVYKRNENELTTFYTTDAIFSLTFPKMKGTSPLSSLFTINRNLAIFKPKFSQVSGGHAILGLLRQYFPNGFNITRSEISYQLVKSTFLGVTISGEVEILSQPLKFAKSLVVIGKNEKFFISNDNLALFS